MRIVIPGGTGQVGTLLARAFLADGHDVVVLSRRPERAPWRVVQWDAQMLGPWVSELDGADVVINLAGRSVNCRYTPENRQAILESRVQSAAVVGKAIAACERPPALWLQASTATIYAHRLDAPNDDVSGVIGGHEPDVPDDLAAALAEAPAKIRAVWEDITPMARWEWVRWVQATSNPETRQRRVEVSISKMDNGKRRPCCFDLSSCTDPNLSKSGKLRDVS